MSKAGIIAFAFGVPDTLPSNRHIAEIAERNALYLHAPIYTQRDIRIVAKGTSVFYTTEENGNPPPTLRIARGGVQWAMKLGIAELRIVAAKPHLWRAVRDVKKAVREAGADIDVHICEEDEQYDEDWWFCPDSEQERVRSPELWNKRERILKVMPFFLYKNIAS